jgi:Reverse transcriptase (RNA-dependent DNA polymerase)
MCPLYKKKEKTNIENYRPITLLNTDYKLLTKALTIQLTEIISPLIHKDQAGFIPGWSIFDHIRTLKVMTKYLEMMKENGAIIALDQEKAYDKINHSYLWKTLEAFNLPTCFQNTVKYLYQNTSTVVAINGTFSKLYHCHQRCTTRGPPVMLPIQPSHRTNGMHDQKQPKP